MWDVDLSPSLLKGLLGADAPALESKSKPAEPLDDQVGISEPLPLHGPPRAWIHEHGPTPDCGAVYTLAVDMERSIQKLAVVGPWNLNRDPLG